VAIRNRPSLTHTPAIGRRGKTEIIELSRHVTFALLVMFSLAAPATARQRDAAAATRDTVARFNDAINKHDAAAVAALLTEDTVFENTGPAPDGARITGKAAVAAFWEKWFVANADATFEAEEIIVTGDRAVVRWIYRKTRDGKPWHLRGVDVFAVRDGKIAAKLAYVKG
jgi:ketosteroid isomerase-like protein